MEIPHSYRADVPDGMVGTAPNRASDSLLGADEFDIQSALPDN